MMRRSPFCTAVLAIAFAAPLLAQQPTLSAALEYSFRPHAGLLRQVAFSPDATLLATSSVDHTVKLWRLADGRLVRTLVHPEGVTSIAFSADGQWLASGSYDGSVSLWRLRDGTLARRVPAHTGTVWSVDFNNDGSQLASSGEDKLVRTWRSADGAAVRSFSGHSLNVWHVAFTPDGTRLVSGSFDHTVRVWRTESGSAERVLTQPTQAVVSVAVSPDGSVIAGGGDDSAVRFWRLADGALLHTLTGSNHVYTLAFSRDGRWLVSGGRMRGAIGTLWHEVAGSRLSGARKPTIRLWRVSDGALQQTLAEDDDDVWSVALSSDGRWLASSGADGTVKLYRLRSSP